ncbi:MAG: HAMP domain-containing histidine kinase [Synechococcaceae cyanobacterium SM2_3_1]|nr:HAMP domain-containing histidine kinase [Synechococcaceae cyanobacterium SM2_3_1]
MDPLQNQPSSAESLPLQPPTPAIPTANPFLQSEDQPCKSMIQELRQYLNNIQGITALLPVLQGDEIHEYMQLLAQEVRTISDLINRQSRY